MRLLVIAKGCGGGIGRVEQLLDRSWAVLEEKHPLQVEVIRKIGVNVPQPVGKAQRWQAHGSRRRLASLALRRFIATRPNIVIFSQLNVVPLGLLMKAVWPRTHVITMVHGIEVWDPISPLTALALRRCDAIWSVSAYTKEMVIKRANLSKEKVHLLPNALLPEQMEALMPDHKNPDRSENGTASVLSVARLDEGDRQKGIDTVIQALPLVVDRFPNVSYKIVGNGNDVGRLQSLMSRTGVERHVQLMGALDDSALFRAYKECDVFVLPSAKEGFGLVFIEAMAAGKPVIAARAGGAGEVVLHADTGLLIDYGNVRELADQLRVLLNNVELRRRMGVAARRRVEEQFTFDRYVTRVAELIGTAN